MIRKKYGINSVSFELFVKALIFYCIPVDCSYILGGSAAIPYKNQKRKNKQQCSSVLADILTQSKLHSSSALCPTATTTMNKKSKR